MSGLEHNAHLVARKFKNAAAAIRAEVSGELHGQSELLAAEMKRRAETFRSQLVNSIRVDRESQLSYFVGPHVAHALWREKGRKPGKGLPRFFDPAAASVVAWLQANAPTSSAAGPIKPPGRQARIGSKRRQAEELALRDRYMAFSRHVKFKGLKAHPIVKPTADESRGRVNSALLAAVKRGAQRFNESRASS